MKRFTLLFLLLMILRAMPAGAIVNVKTAAYVRTEIDWVSENKRFQLTRTYSSRNLHLGFFGFGWCSNLELAIVPQADGTLKVKDCNGIQEYIFRKRNSPVDTNPVYARPGTDEILMATDGQFLLRRGEETDYFDGNGRWTGRRTPEDTWSFEYSGDLPTRIKINGQILHFEPLYGNRRIKRAHGHGWEIHYQYSDQDLSLIRSVAQNASYRYDDFHNLTHVQNLDGFVETIQYDEKLDRVKSVNRGDCREDYTYVTQQGLFLSEVVTDCAGKLPVKVSYQFNWRDQQARLTFLKMQSGKSRLIATYDSAEKLARTELLLGRKAVTLLFDSQQRPLVPKELDTGAVVTVLSALRIGSGGPI